jgi:hypothetical protein
VSAIQVLSGTSLAVVGRVYRQVVRFEAMQWFATPVGLGACLEYPGNSWKQLENQYFPP